MFLLACVYIRISIKFQLWNLIEFVKTLNFNKPRQFVFPTLKYIINYFIMKEYIKFPGKENFFINKLDYFI